MDSPLDTVAVRVLGSMIEKEITTPDNYPLSLNALTAACNQSSNRDPVMTLDERTILRSLDELRRRSLARGMQRSDSRVTKYQHLASEAMALSSAELAVMCVLMLRGQQTAGEIKTRTARLYDFSDVAQVDATLEGLITRLPASLIKRLPRRPGQKEVRYAHLLSGDVTVDTTADSAASDAVHDARTAPSPGRLDALEHAVNSLRAEVADLRAQLDEFRRAFQ